MGGVGRAGAGFWVGVTMLVGSQGLGAQIVESSMARPEWTDVELRHATSPIRIDGRLEEDAWEDAERIDLPWEISPLVNAQAGQETDCRITFDDDYLYYGCRALDDDPESIRAFLVDRDQTAGQDEVGLVIDPFRDSRRAFGFNVNPLGVQKDWVYDREEGNDAWDAIWDSRGRITDEGWEMEAAIPFKSFRFPATRDVQSWGFFIFRARPRSESVTMRSVPSNPSNQCALCQMAVARGIHSVGAGLNVEIAPFATAQRTDLRPSPDLQGLQAGDVVDEYGVDARWSVTSDATVNLAFNPDFSQVEADAPQLQSNQQFALFFPERRPFFLEGAEFFETPFRAVFTRTVADPSFGAKLTGKAGGWAFGTLAARDERTNLLLPGPQASESTTIDAGNTALIARARRDVGDASTVGALVTARDGEDGYRNFVAGIDARIRLHSTTTLTSQLLRSETRYPNDLALAHAQPLGSFAGWSGKTMLSFATREASLETFVTHIEPDFRADGGFMTQADYQQFDIRGGRDFWMDEHPWLTRWRAFGGGGRFQQSDGTLIGQFIFTSFGVFGPWQSELTVNPDLFERELQGQRFTIERLNLFGHVQPTARVAADIFWQFGRELDYANVRESGLTRMQQGLDLRLGAAVELELDYDFKRLTHAGTRVFREQVAQTRALYHFSDRFFLRAVLQLRDVDRDPGLYAEAIDPETRSLDTQFLLSYKLNPQSVIFVGYSDASAAVRENEDPLESLDLSRLSRTFFLKVSYAWRP